MWPFNRKFSQRNHIDVSSVEVVKRDSEYLSIPEFDFYGQSSESPNSRFILGWCDAFDPHELNAVIRKGGFSYVLVDSGTIVTYGWLERPNHGKVGNNGSFIINDWLFENQMKSTFYAFDKSGNTLVKYGFEANLFNNGLSDDGSIAVCQCCNSDSKDRCALACFDLENRKLLWKTIPEVGWADRYSFQCQKGHITLIYRDKGEFRYSFDGTFIDSEKWEIEKIRYYSAFEHAECGVSMFKMNKDNLDQSTVNEIFSHLDKSLTKGIDQYPNEKALVLRTFGEIFEIQGNILKAIESYEAALMLNPKVGVKKRLQKLKDSAN